MKRITVIFTEEDRQKAKRYGDICGCILYTALTRMGFEVSSVGGSSATIAGRYYRFAKWFDPDKTNFVEKSAARKPFYKESIVGRKLNLHAE